MVLLLGLTLDSTGSMKADGQLNKKLIDNDNVIDMFAYQASKIGGGSSNIEYAMAA